MSYDSNRNFDILSGDSGINTDAKLYSAEEDQILRPKPLPNFVTPWDNRSKIMGGLSEIASGNPWGVASGIAHMVNNTDPTAAGFGKGDAVATRFGQLGGIANGNALGKASSISDMMGNTKMAGTFGTMSNISNDPKGAAVGMLTKGVGGPMGMVLGYGLSSAMGSGGPSYDTNSGQRILNKNKALYEDQNQQMLANRMSNEGRYV